MNDLFSVRCNYATNLNKSKPESELRTSINQVFYNMYVEAPDKHLRMQREIMSFFGIEQENTPTVKAIIIKNNADKLRAFLASCEWYQVYDFIEYIFAYCCDDDFDCLDLKEQINEILKYQGYRYRIEGGKVIPVVNDEELTEIHKAMNTGIESVDKSYHEAVKLLSEKMNPDYNAVISKASNALEAMVVTIANQEGYAEDTLGRAISKLESNRIIIDERLVNVSKDIYKYACNSGIRHGGVDSTVASENDAVYILVLCAACINYLNYLYQTTELKES